MMKHLLKTLLLFFALTQFSSCSGNDNSTQYQIVGSWELMRIEDSESGIATPPNDNKPVVFNFRSDGTFDGRAGNNDIQGEYRLEGSTLIFTLSTTEIVNTDWELLFKQNIEQARTGSEYNTPFDLVTDTELTLEYNNQDKMFFMGI